LHLVLSFYQSVIRYGQILQLGLQFHKITAVFIYHFSFTFFKKVVSLLNRRVYQFLSF